MLAAEEQTGETPQALRDKPVLHQWLVWVYEAFWVCDSGRPIYQGSVGRIPLSELVSYMAVFDVGETDAKQLFIKMMRALDSVYVKLINAEITRQIEQERKDQESKTERGRG